MAKKIKEQEQVPVAQVPLDLLDTGSTQTGEAPKAEATPKANPEKQPKKPRTKRKAAKAKGVPETSATLPAAAADVKAELERAKDLPLEQRVALYNELSAALKDMVGLPHPVLGVQLVKADLVESNDYNPNKVAPPEMRLLTLSIRKDGVTMPVVAARSSQEGKYVVVDGYHRTQVIQGTKDVHESLGGYVPLVELNKTVEDRITSTVRHNMARGTHQVELSAKLVAALKKHNWTNQRIGMELGMDPDEVLRLKQITGLAEAFKDKEFSKAWE